MDLGLVPKTAYYCPECKREYLVASTGPIRCGQCKVRWGREIELVKDPGAGDVSKDLIIPRDVREFTE